MEVFLKRCPICGAEPMLPLDKATYEKLVAEHGSACVYIQCSDSNCGIHHYCYGEPGESYESIMERAIKKWNRRVGNV